MKPGHKKTKSDYPYHLKSLQERVKQWALPSGPFDYGIRGKAVAEAHRFYNEAHQLSRHNPYDTKLSELQEHAIHLLRLAMDAAYPPDFDRDFERLRSRDANGLEGAIRFLEADPMFFRTGYTKTKLIRYIKPDMLKPSDAVRLRRVVLSIVDTRDDRDFRSFCRLARKVDAPVLRAALTDRLGSADPAVRRRARWVLDALDAGSTKKAKQP